RIARLRPLVEPLEDRTVPSFISAASYSSGLSAISQVVADFDGDGIRDLAATGFDANGKPGIGILRGKGDGSFEKLPATYAGGSGQLAAGDFNGDGIPDLVASNASLNVLLGNGDGTFQLVQSFHFAPGAIAVGDFN